MSGAGCFTVSSGRAFKQCPVAAYATFPRSAAQYVLDHMPAGRYRGVTFFCPDSGAWQILDTSGSLSIKGSSHLQESETLAIFDDARCRGSDLKLHQKAVGLLTLAAGMPKDKLMQAAGRLRQLGRGQTLVLTGLADVSSKILAAVGIDIGSTGASSSISSASSRFRSASVALPNAWAAAISRRNKRKQAKISKARQAGPSRPADPDMPAVLAWVMANAVQATLAGITQAAAQGMQFAATYGGPPELCVWPERLSVEELYGSRKVREPVSDLLAGVAQHYTAHLQNRLGGLGLEAAPAAPERAVAAVAGVLQTSGSASLAARCRGSGVASMSVDDSSSDSVSSMGISAASPDTQASSSAPCSANATSRASSMQADTTTAAVAAGLVDVIADVHQVQERFSGLGSGHSVLAGQGADEECERELEQEEEEEQEAEVQVPAAVAAHEQDWDWSSVFTATRADQLGSCKAMALPQVLRLVTSSGGVGDISWCDKVLATQNFLHSITASPSAASPGLCDYLRPVGALLLFSGSQQLLLLSEREADALQRELWSRGGAGASLSAGHREPPGGPNLLVSLSYLRQACNTDRTAVQHPGHKTRQPLQLLLASKMVAPGRLVSGLGLRPPAAQGAVTYCQTVPPWLVSKAPTALVGLQLFAGCVLYGSEAQRDELHRVMRGRKEAAQELVGWRGKLHMLPRSHLDWACSDDAFDNRG